MHTESGPGWLGWGTVGLGVLTFVSLSVALWIVAL